MGDRCKSRTDQRQKVDKGQNQWTEGGAWTVGSKRPNLSIDCVLRLSSTRDWKRRRADCQVGVPPPRWWMAMVIFFPSDVISPVPSHFVSFLFSALLLPRLTPTFGVWFPRASHCRARAECRLPHTSVSWRCRRSSNNNKPAHHPQNGKVSRGGY